MTSTPRPIVSSEGCFLCQPNHDWVWAEGEHFFAIAALGPIVDGMSIVASRSHLRSMFDVPADLTDELTSFTRFCTDRLAEVYDLPVHVTEHGRVGLCELVRPAHDPHCYHAHRLLFPIDAPLHRGMKASIVRPLRATSFGQAKEAAGHLRAYLYYEGPDGLVLVGADDETKPRQFFRGLVADAVRQPHLRSWRSNPQERRVDAAARALR